MFKLKRYLKNYTTECIVAPLFKFIETVFELTIPLLMGEMIDVGIKHGNVEYCFFLTLTMCIFAALGLGCSVIAQYFAARAAHGYGTELRTAMYKKINELSHSDIDKIGTPTLITRITADVNQAEKGLNRFLRLFLRSPFIVLGALVASFIINVDLGLIFLGVTVVMAIIITVIMLLTIPRNKAVQGKLDELNGITRENLSGARVVRAFAMQEEETKRFAEKNERLMKMQTVVGKISALLNPATYVFVNLGVVLVLWLGGGLVDGGLLSQGQISALINYMSQILLALVVLANLIIVMASGSASSERIRELLDIEPSLQEGDGVNDELPETVIKFDSVCFKYNEGGDNVLTDINFTVKRGETVGIIGGTGSGKSTVIGLAERFYDVGSGEISVDGMPVKEYKFDALRQKFGLVPQKAVLFKGTVRENMKWGNPEATDEEIYRALDIAQAREFVDENQLKLDRMIEQGGRNLSGGQRQRLTIARALVRKPEILVLDDSSSALDYATDFKLRKAIKENLTDTTVIIISQRAGSIKYADKILVMDEGKLVGAGPHAKLLRSCPIYREICLSQLDGDKRGKLKEAAE